MSSGGGGSQNVTQTNMPAWAKPYYVQLMQSTGKNIFNTDSTGSVTGIKSYTPYAGGDVNARVAGFNPNQQQVFGETMGLQTPEEFDYASQGAGMGTGMAFNAARAGLGNALGYTPGAFNVANVRAPNLTNYQMGGPENVSASELQNYGMNAAQTGFRPDLNYFQMAAPERVGSMGFSPEAASYYMSPFQKNVSDVAANEVQRRANAAKAEGTMGSINRGTFSGSRSALLQAEQDRNTEQNIGNIYTQGQQAAYQNAQQAFQQDRDSMMRAALANQQAGLTSGQANLQALLSTQQLGTQTGAQIALANLSNEQQANVQNLAAQLQTQGLSADQALRAALANQQAGLTTGQENLRALLGIQQLGSEGDLRAQLANQQYGLEGQRLSDASRQFAANIGKDIGLSGLQQGLSGSELFGRLGALRQQSNLDRLKAQAGVGSQEQQLAQQRLDAIYQAAMEGRDWDKSQLQFLSDILRGNANALGSKTVSYTQSNPLTQAAGLGVAGLGAYLRGS